MKRQVFLANLVVGILGALTGGFWSSTYLVFGESFEPGIHLLTILAGFVSGFLCCFYLSNRYIKMMSRQDYATIIISGLCFGVFAGIISGILTGATFAFVTNPSSYRDFQSSFVFATLVGIAFGVISGAIIGLVSATIFGQSLIRKLADKTTSHRMPVKTLAKTIAVWFAGILLIYIVVNMLSGESLSYLLQNLLIVAFLVIEYLVSRHRDRHRQAMYSSGEAETTVIEYLHDNYPPDT